MVRRTLVFLVMCVTVILTQAAAAHAATPNRAASTVFDSFDPNDVLPGAWSPVGEPHQFAVGDQTDGRCIATVRTWDRDDKVRLGLAWYSCGEAVMSTALTSRGLARTTHPDLDESTVLGDAEHIARYTSNGIGRSWQEGGYEVEVLCIGPERTCLDLTGTVAKAVSNALPGEPIPAQLIPKGSAIVAAFLVSWLLFVGLPMVGGYFSSGRYSNGPLRPNVTAVDGAATRLRWRQRGRRFGQVLIVVGLILTITRLIPLVARGVVPGIGGLVTAAVLMAAGTVLVALCRHPQLTAGWLRYRWHLGRHTARRLASLVLTAIVGVVAAAGPVVGVLALFFLSLLGMADDASRIWAGLIFAGVGAGALVDILARRLRARTAREAIDDEIERGGKKILYLRNFGDDAAKLPASALTRRGLFATLVAPVNPLRRARFEELLGRALGRWGAVIGLGQPGLVLPTLGVAKTEPVKGSWRQQVRTLADDAYAIVVSATPAELGRGLKWELDHLAQAANHGRIVLVLGPQSGKHTPMQRFSSFLAVTECYDLFYPLGQSWVPDGALVLVHVPATRSWHAWTARRRTAWTYTAAIDAAFEFAERAWSQPAQPVTAQAAGPLVDSVRLALDDASETAVRLQRLDEPAEGDPVDTRHVMAALIRRHPQSQWSRIAPVSPDLVESTPGADADAEAGGYWRGVPLTGTAHSSILSALRIARGYRLQPVPVGVLALAIVTEGGSGAAEALSVLSGSTPQDIAKAIQHDLLGATLVGVQPQQAPSAAVGIAAGVPPRTSRISAGTNPLASPSQIVQAPFTSAGASPDRRIQPAFRVTASPAPSPMRLRPAAFVWSAIIVSLFGIAPFQAASEEPLSTVLALIGFGLVMGPVILWAVVRSLSGSRYAWRLCLGGTLALVALYVVALLRVTGT